MTPVQAWFNHHLYALFSSLGLMLRAPLPSLMTAAVIGIALALPAGLYLLLENTMRISQDWDDTVYISLFLQPNVSDTEAEVQAEQLQNHPAIAEVRLISKTEALDEYQHLSGFSDALKALEENPLPAVLVVRPNLSNQDAIKQLLDELSKLPTVDIAQFDMRWLQRLFAILNIIQRGVLILAVLLALAVLLVIGNTIRLAVQNRQAEIEVNKLFGATDAFIRRPFLYTGLWFGLAGGVIATALLSISFHFLEQPARQLAALYAGHYELMNLGWQNTALLLLSSGVLGLLGAALAVTQQLRKLEPK
jgi:cell division transport system permease protein